jgi:predicted CXXCH cytochrome family protein
MSSLLPALLLIAVSEALPATNPAPGADLASCGSCHAPLTAGKNKHGILRSGACTDCHTAAPAGAPGKCKSPTSAAWTLKAKEPGLCYRCHPRLDDEKHVHTAVAKGQCLGCHEAHASDVVPLLKDTREQLCLTCHQASALAKKHVKHAPVMEKRCLDCHDPHRSENPAQTVEAGKKLCLACHDATAKTAKGSPSRAFRVDLAAETVHKPVKSGDCQDCHVQSHSGDTHLLKQPVAETCARCHPRPDDLPYLHGAFKLGDCAVCHDPHSSQNKALLRDAKINDTCFRCHQDDVTARAWVHEPVRKQGCTACHEPHGADFRFNLRDGEGAALCLKCHQNPAVAKVTVKHLALERYGCTACHDPHGANNDKGLIKPVNELCASCHRAQADGAHVSSLIAGGHKLSGGPDPHAPEKDFSCVSCHDAHGSDHPKLFPFGRSAMESCVYCHGDRTGKFPEMKDVTRVRRPAAAPGTTASTLPPTPPGR